MGRTIPLQDNWRGGMKRDFARSQLPPNSAWNIVDMIVNSGEAPLQQRGYLAHWSQDISSVTSTASYIRGGVYAVFSTTAGGTNPKNLAIDEDGRLYNVTAQTAASSIGAAVTIAQNPIYHGGTAVSGTATEFPGLVIIPDGTGAAVPKKYNGTTLGDLSGSPPKARFGTVYKDFTALANGTVGSTYYPNRVWFSPAGDPDCAASTSWDTTNSWIDFSLPVRGIASTKNAILVFHDGQVSRIRGSTPPPDEDMVVDDPLFQVGLLDPFSITYWKDNVYWAAPEGLYRSDGVILDDVTKKGGMLQYWLSTFSGATATYTVATGVYNDQLFISVMNGSTIVDGFIVDTQTYAWVRISNLDAVAMWSGQRTTADELYYGRRNGPYVGNASNVFLAANSTSSIATDTPGTVEIAPVFESAFYTIGPPGLKRLRRLFCGVFLRDPAGSNPTAAVSFITVPTTQTEITGATLTENLSSELTYKRDSIPLNRLGYGIGVKIARSDAGNFSIWDLSVDAHPLEKTRRTPR